MGTLELLFILLVTCLVAVLERKLIDRQRDRLVGKQANLPLANSPHGEPGPKVSLRFRDLPKGIDMPTFHKALADTEDEAGRRAPDYAGDAIVHMSLTQSVISGSSVATVCYTRLPQRIQSQINRNGNGMDGAISYQFGSGTHRVRVDDHFYGLTPLYWPEDWHFDIVAVTGWNGNAFWSWKPKNGRQMWLRDWLGQDLAKDGCHARIFTYGYPSKVANSSSDATLSDYAKQFLLSLAAARKAELTVGKTKPLIFIGHSLGGLVIKQAMKDAYNSRDGTEQDLYKSCICIVMLGVPNLGLDNEAIRAMTNGQKNDEFARNLGYNSQYLRELDKNFSIAFRERPIDIIAVHETEDSPSVEVRYSILSKLKVVANKDVIKYKNGQWSRTGPKTRLVSRESACSLGLGADTERLASLTNHSNLAKFAYPDNEIYQTLVVRLLKSSKQARIQNQQKLLAQALPETKGTTEIDVPHDMLTNHFIGREEILSEIYRCFSVDGNQVFVLHGNGGMGKTQIALKHAQRCSSMYKMVVWIQADSDKRMQGSFRYVAATMGFDDKREDAASYVLSKLAQAAGKVLLIYDNLDDRSMMTSIGTSHKPKWKGAVRVLITTRDREYLLLRTQASIVEPLGAADAAQLLRGLVGHENETDPDADSNVSEICDALGNLPLGIQQAAAYMTTSGISCKHFLSVLSKEPQRTLEYKARLWPYEQTVFTVWEASLARVEETSQYASRWFFLCSLLDTTVTHTLFELAYRFCQRTPKDNRRGARRHIAWLYTNNTTAPSSVWTTATLQLSLLELQSLSLISTSCQRGQEACTTFHPLVRQWARLRLPRNKQEEFLVMATSLIHACAEELRDQQDARRDTSTAYYAQRQLISHAHSCVQFCTYVLNRNLAWLVPVEVTITLATFYIHGEDYQLAQTMLEIALQRPDEDPMDISEAQRALAWALRKQDKPGEALPLQRRAIAGLARLEPFAQSGEVLRARAELATIYRDINNLEEAIQLQSEVVEDAKLIFGPDASDTLHEMSCLATIHSRRKEFEKACQIDEYVLAVYKEKQGNSSEIVIKMKNLAITYYLLKRYDQAIELEKAVLERMQCLHSLYHPETASAMHNLATTYMAAGQLRQALTLFSEALTIRQATLGETHRRTQKSARLEAETRRLLASAAADQYAQDPIQPERLGGTQGWI